MNHLKSAVTMTVMSTLLIGCGPSLDLTDDQQSFVSLIEESKEAYNNAENSIQESRARQARAEELCAHFSDGLEVQEWQGEVKAIHSTMTGDVGIELLIAKNLTLQTATTSLTFDNDTQATLISEDSPLYEKVASLASGDTVKFSGAFIKGSDKDCLMEVSVTEQANSHGWAYENRRRCNSCLACMACSRAC